ncbi:MAG: UvrD-helicase domain-containing protein [Terriglobales bacterium]
MASKPAAAPAPLPDAAARAAALGPNRSFIVEAPAGAGKTGLLTRRLLALLARVERPECILALTFTKKAAAEMRDRVLQALRGGSAEGGLLDAEFEALAAAARQRDQTLGWGLAENPARLRLHTIDAFVNGLTAQAPLASRMAARTVWEDAEPLYQQAARRLLAEFDGQEPAQAPVRAALAALLEHLDNDWPRLAGLLAQMLAVRDQWLPLLGAGRSNTDARAALERSLQKVIRAAMAAARAAIPPELASELAALARYAAQNAGPEEKVATAAGGDLSAPPGGEPEDLPLWQGIAAIFLSGEARRKKIDVRGGFPAGEGKAKAMKNRWKAACAALSEAAIATLAGLRVMPAAAYTDAQWRVLAALLSLLPRAAAHLELLCQQKSAADFIAYTLAAQAALGRDEAPAEIALVWDARLEHLLVDEFQDTSQSQLELLRRLTRDWQPGDGRTVFLVGDPKQSIYGFRQAEVELFLRLSGDRRWGVVPIEPLSLKTNFRSAPVLTKWFNRALQDAFPPAANARLGAVPYSSCEAAPGAVVSPPPGAEAQFLRLPWLPGPPGQRGRADRGREAAEVVRLVRQARAADPSASVAILVRAKSHAGRILAALAAAEISVQANLDPLGDRPTVLDLLSLTRALLRPADRVAWLAILRAPWCGLGLADLLALADGDPAASIWDTCQDSARRGRLSPPGLVALGRCLPVLAQAQAAVGRQPLHRVVEGAWIALGGCAAVRPAQRSADLQDARAYLDLLATLEQAGDVDLDYLAERAGALRAAPRPDTSAVQVMTIHQAKGLEFATVIVPGLDCIPGQDSPPLLAWEELPAEGDLPPELLLAPIHATGAEEPIYQYLRAIAKQKRRQEAVRLLYVAATRAQRRLYLLGGWSPDGAADRRSLAALLCPQGVAPPPVVELPPEGDEGGMAAVAALLVSPRRLLASWRPAPLPAAVGIPIAASPMGVPAQASFEWVRPTARHIGVVVHAWLGGMTGQSHPAPWPAAAIRARLAQEGVAAADLPAAAARAAKAMAEVLADERGHWLLAAHEDDRSEWALAGLEVGSTAAGATPRHIRLDRSFIADGVRWIVDYKTSLHEGGDLGRFLQEEQRRYRPQLETYATLLRADETRPIRLALYFPLIPVNGRPAWREWHFGAEPAAAG